MIPKGTDQMGELERKIKQYAKSLGFHLVGITGSGPFLRDEQASIERIRAGLMDGLPWYTEERVHRATRPETLLEGAESVISLGISYLNENPENADDELRGSRRNE